jgi:hypothetical protein
MFLTFELSRNVRGINPYLIWQKKIWISEIMTVALFSLLIGTEDACLPKVGKTPAVGREDVPIASGEDPTRRGRPKCTIINLATIIFSPLLLADKVADN